VWRFYTFPMRTHRSLLFLPLFLCLGTGPLDAVAQADNSPQAVRVEGNMRTEYAEVLRVEPVYLPAAQDADGTPCAAVVADPTTHDACVYAEIGDDGQMVVYDVDYVLRGVKYRSRLPYDPGTRLKVRSSVTPMLPPEPLPEP